MLYVVLARGLFVLLICLQFDTCGLGWVCWLLCLIAVCFGLWVDVLWVGGFAFWVLWLYLIDVV